MNIPEYSDPQNTEVDTREQLFNQRKIGPVTEVSTAVECVTSLAGVFFDVDPKIFRQSVIIPEVPTDPVTFYENVLRPRLDRHELARHAEVRMSGTGLHALLWFSEAVAFETDADRQRWTGIVKVLQASLPTDPDAPHITALTRPLGSINSKNGAVVTQLAPGEPVEAEAVIEFYQRVSKSPFRTVMKILLGDERVEPCPLCQKPDTKLEALDHVGKCYGSCGKVKLGQLYDIVLKTREAAQ